MGNISVIRSNRIIIKTLSASIFLFTAMLARAQDPTITQPLTPRPDHELFMWQAHDGDGTKGEVFDSFEMQSPLAR